MANKAEASLLQLSSFAQSLNKVSDELSTALDQVETILNSYRLGVSAWVKVKSEEMYEQGGSVRYTEATWLGYDKYKGKWGLVVGTEIEEVGELQESGFLREASREVRIAAIEKIPELAEKLVKDAEKIVADAAAGATKAKELATLMARQKKG